MDYEKNNVRTIKSIIADFIREKKPEDVGYYQQIYDWLDGRHIEQKPVEWNDTDMNEARENLITCCRDWEKGEPTTLLPIVAKRARHFLENTKPVEWSEEDERRLDAVVDLLENTSAIHPNYSHRKLIIWLKSLRPQPHWKPSEEQMGAILNAEGILRSQQYDGTAAILAGLYDQLKQRKI